MDLSCQSLIRAKPVKRLVVEPDDWRSDHCCGHLSIITSAPLEVLLQNDQ